MAKKRQVVSIETIRAKRRCKVRYGRARLTINRWGHLSHGAVAEALLAHKRDEKSAEDVAWAYVRARVEDHTPSFKWGEADLDRLITLVTECSKSPEIKARSAEDLAAELEQRRQEEIEQLTKAGEQFSKYIRRMTVDWAKVTPTWPAMKLAQQQLDQSRRLSQALSSQRSVAEIAKGLDINRRFGKSILDMGVGNQVSEAILAASVANKVTLNYDSLLKSVLPAMPRVKPLIADLDFSTQKAFSELLGSYSIKGILSDQLIKSIPPGFATNDLWRASREAAEAARKAKQERTAAAFEATAEVLEGVEAEPPIEVIERALRPLFDEVIAAIKESRQQPSPWLMLILGCLLSLALEILAARAGLLGP